MVPMNIDGTSSSLTVSEKDSKLTLVVPVSSLSTGLDMRDKHMKDKDLQAGQHPSITLVVERSALQFPTNGAPRPTPRASSRCTVRRRTESSRTPPHQTRAGSRSAASSR